MAREIYAQINQWSLAERTALAALDVAPEDATTHLEYAKLLAKNVSFFNYNFNWIPRDTSPSSDKMACGN